jgi:hypothetical protein
MYQALEIDPDQTAGFHYLIMKHSFQEFAYFFTKESDDHVCNLLNQYEKNNVGNSEVNAARP